MFDNFEVLEESRHVEILIEEELEGLSDEDINEIYEVLILNNR